MKKIVVLVSVLLAVVLVTVGCGENTNNAAEDNMGNNEVEDVMMDEEKDDMTDDMMDEEKEDMSDEMMDEEDVTDGMTEESDENMGHEDMMDDESKEDEAVMEEEMMNEGDPVADLALTAFDGSTVSLVDYEGEKLYVKYWGSWCSICMAGLDEVDELSGTEDFKVLTIVAPNYNGEMSVEEFKEWFEGLETENMTVLFDEEAAYAQSFGVIGFPTSIYIGSDGIVTSVTPGHSSNEVIIGKMESLY